MLANKDKMKLIILNCILVLNLFSQSTWKRSEPIEEKPFTIFKSTQAFNVHTAEVLPKSDLFYDISHRFNGSISDGYSTFFGLDNGATIRMSLGYGITDNLMVSIGRSNREANHDIQFKYKLYQTKSAGLPMIFALNLGTSFNGRPRIDREDDKLQIQYFGSFLANFELLKGLAIGFSPTYLHNAIAWSDYDTYSFVLGTYLQYYLGDDMTSFVIEGMNTLSGWRGNGSSPFYDTYTIGVEFETGGHFFKLLVSNNTLLNQTQLLAGSPVEFQLKNLVFGFQITRNFGL
jgi:hypothetical protein